MSGFFTTIGITLANTAAPVVAITGERASDLNAWLVIKAGSSGIFGAYQITAVDTVGHTYTLNAAIGAAVLANGTPNTAVGCGSIATLTNQTCSVDFTQQAAYTATGTVTSSTTTVTAVTPIFTKQMVGNGITDGTTWKVITAYTSTTVVTVDSAPTWVAATVYVGGALASPGKAGSLMVAGNDLFIKSGTYTVTSATANVAGGCLSIPTNSSTSNATYCTGYQSVRGDGGTKPIIKADGIITTFTLVNTAASATGPTISYLEVDGNNRTSSKGIDISTGQLTAHHCLARNCTAGGLIGAGGARFFWFCEATTCSTVSAFNGGQYFYCYSHDNTITGMTCSGGGVGQVSFCLSCNNSGASSDGISFTGGTINSCTSYGNGRHGFNLVGVTTVGAAFNCLAVNNGLSSGTGWGFNSASADVYSLVNCAGFNNQSGNTTGVNANRILNFQTLTADPFTNAAAGDWSLNTAAGGGALCRSAGIPGAFPAGTTIGYIAIGAVIPNTNTVASGSAG